MSRRMNYEKLTKQDKVRKYRNTTDYKKKEKLTSIRMNAKYKGICFTCKKAFAIDTKIKYFPRISKAVHANCKNPSLAYSL